MNLAEGLARQLVRVAKLRQAYVDVGPAGTFALSMIDAGLEAACKACGEGDVTKMISANIVLEGFQG